MPNPLPAPAQARRSEQGARGLVPRYPTWATQLAQEFDVGVAQDPTTFVTRPAHCTPATSYRFPWERPLNDWPPPGTLPDGTAYLWFPSEQEHWMNLYGDPTSKEHDDED